jgi:hypothetical protein
MSFVYEQGIGFHKNDNAFLAVDQVAALPPPPTA